MNSAHKTAVIIRGTITAILFFAGFAFPLIWIAAAFFAYTTFQAFPDPEPDTPENMYRPRQSAVTADDPDWREFFLAACESPAETAFLEAMIKGYDLKPDNGILVAPGFELDMQTEYKPYRLDFLVNKWLVVEVDGAEWHSSAEAVERDRVRDQFFSEKGFSVLRIPAKTVFRTPTKAVGMVRAAIARGRPPQKAAVKSPPISVAKTFTNLAKSVDRFVTEVDANATKFTAIDNAMGPAKKTFESEKMVVDTALSIAESKIGFERQRGREMVLRKSFETAFAELDGVLQRAHEREKAPVSDGGDGRVSIEPITTPDVHHDADINTIISNSYLHLMKQRSEYFAQVRSRLKQDPYLIEPMQTCMRSMGCMKTWAKVIDPNR